MNTYDETDLLARLSRLAPERRVAFAALCAERLVTLFDRYAQAVGARDGTLQDALDAVWDSLDGLGTDVESAAETAEALVPDEDGEWVAEAAYAQNSAAAVAFAARAQASGDAQDAVWSARQVYEAADQAAQHDVDPAQFTSADEQALGGHPLVQEALRALAADLDAVESARPDLPALRRVAQEDGAAWAARLL